MNTTANPNIGKYISGVINISIKFGISSLLSIILLMPAPKDTPINSWGAKPMTEPKK